MDPEKYDLYIFFIKAIITVITVISGLLVVNKIKVYITQKNKVIDKSKKLQKASSSGGDIKQENIGTQNNFYISKEEALGNPANNQKDIMNNGFSKIKISDEKLQKIGCFFNKVFKTVGSARNGLTMLEGSVFALGSKDFRNKEWAEHCSASLRELLHHWKGNPGQISKSFNLAFKNGESKFPNIKTDREFYERMSFYYYYFSGKCHHNPEGSLYALRALYNDESIKTADDSDEKFLEVVKDFLEELSDFVNKYDK